MATDSFSIEVSEYEGVPVLEIASEELFRTATRTMNTWRDNLRNGTGADGSHGRPWVNTGEAANSVTIDPPREGALEYLVGGDRIQLAVAETGRAPGAMPPPEPIVDWMREQLGVDDPDPWPIQKKIEEEGIEGFAPGRAAVNEHAPELSERVATRIDAELEEQRSD
jgi:hypothetical protein